MPRWLAAMVLGVAVGCGGDDVATGRDAGRPDGGPRDAGAHDGSDDRDAGPGPDLDSGPAPEPPPYDDIAIGPYPSALRILVDSLPPLAERFDTRANYDHSAAQGYVLQATALLLDDSRGRSLPGGRATRDALVHMALDEIAELREASTRVTSGGPAFGLPDAWDAFGDGSTNPAYTGYTWQSGMVALGAAMLLRYLDRGESVVPEIEREELRAFVESLVGYWHAYYTRVADGGWFWYSDRASDDKAVHNTSALVAMASQIVFEQGGAGFDVRAREVADLFRARLRSGSSGYVWNYVDDNYPAASRRPEDISHALVTLQLARFALERGWYAEADGAAFSRTLLGQIWSGNPLRLHGRVDGSSAGDDDFTYSRANAIGWAAHGDAPGGDPAVFDYARSIIFSNVLARADVPLEGGRTDAVGVLALARLLAHRPDAFASAVGSRWERVAGAGDDTPSPPEGGTRFYVADWDAPRDVTLGGLTLPARVATAANANFLVDLPDGDTRDVVVSIVWESGTSGTVEQWDGTDYTPVAPLPATLDVTGTVRWARTSFRMRPGARFDYEGNPGTNVLFQITNSVALHRIEATPL